MKLLLFDIDGTLLISHGAGRQAMEETVYRMAGLRHATTNGIDFSGRTDPQIIRDILLLNGFDETEVDAHLPEALATYIAAFQENFVPGQVEALPGVQALIETLAELPHVHLSLLTGNLEPTGYLKLNAIGLDRYFPYGAFGSDHPDRYQLPRIALKRARAKTGTSFSGKDVVIIGDTRHDILCGRDLDVFTIAVSTGHYSTEDLLAYSPDVLLEDLSDVDRFVALVGE